MGGGWHRRGRRRARAGGKGRRKLAAKWPRTNSKNKSPGATSTLDRSTLATEGCTNAVCPLECSRVTINKRRVAPRPSCSSYSAARVGQSTRDHHRAYTRENSEILRLRFPVEKKGADSHDGFQWTRRFVRVKCRTMRRRGTESEECEAR